MVDYKKLKELREETGVSFSLVKKALEQSNNDMATAKKKLKSWGVERASAKSDRQTSQGAIFSYVHHNKRIASLVTLNCETDFVSGNSDFQTLGAELAMQAASVVARDVDEFLKQAYIRDPGRTIGELVKEAVLKFGENIKVSKILRWEI